MKIIDLLNKIANDEEVPKKIRYQNYIYEYQHRRDAENSFNYMCNENGEYLSRRYFIDNILNDEVEIIEEEKKIPEKLETYKENDDENCYANILKVSKNSECEIDEATSVIVDKINEIINYLDYLKSKGDE